MSKQKQKEYTLDNLVGKTIVDIVIDTDDEETYGLVLESKGGKSKVIAWILQDSEGNGPGALLIQPMKKPKEIR